MSRFNSIKEVRAYLDSIPMFGKVGAAASNFGLENISAFCSKLGDPQKHFKSIHVAGTNGKGSVCHLFEAVYGSAGYKTGMFTSPHLLKYNERVRINGKEVSDKRILEFFQAGEQALEEIPLTYFEMSTSLAFWVFAQEKVDIAIIETGLGGRLDSTNIITPELSVITSIAKDHEAILGNTMSHIAKEKAGIIKQGIPVVIGNIEGDALQVIQHTAKKKNSELVKSSDRSPDWSNGRVILQNPEMELSIQLPEPVNAWNVTMVQTGVELLTDRFPVDEDVFKKVIEDFKGVPARFEKLSQDYEWYFSGSHNIQAIDSMLEAVNHFKTGRKVLVFSIMRDKISEGLLSRFRLFDEIYFFAMDSERAAKAEDIASYLTFNNIGENNYKEIFNELKTSLVICAGSFYFYPIIKRWLI